jgi:hypothetical protein
MLHARRPGLAAVAAALWLAGCAPAPNADGQETDTTAPGVSDETLYALEGEDPADEELVSYAVPPEELISADSIGPARAGSTLAELQAVIGGAPVRFVQNFIVDFSAVCVDDAAGDELYCAVIPATDAPSPDTTIEMLTTRHPRFKTREGVGPGVAIADAAVVFGDAFLSYSDDDEGREYVEFDRGPVGSIRFRTLAPSGPAAKAGVYEDSAGPFHETDEFVPDAVIGAVEVQAPIRE